MIIIKVLQSFFHIFYAHILSKTRNILKYTKDLLMTVLTISSCTHLHFEQESFDPGNIIL